MTEHSFQSKKAGLPPGTLVHIGKKRAEKVHISVIDYTEKEFREVEYESIEHCFDYKDSPTTSWINIDGIHNTELIQLLGNHFEHHPLLMEDIVNTLSRPKLEEFQEYLFVTLKMLGIHRDRKSIVTEQVSFILGKNYVISFQELRGDIFEPIRIRLREAKGNIRKRGADYLFYRLIDTVVDNYYTVIEHFSEQIEQLEDQIVKNPEKEVLSDIQALKKQLIQLKKHINPLREAVGIILKDEIKLIHKTTHQYLKDVYDHLVQIAENIEIHRELTKNLMDLHQSGVNQKTNQVMQVLTVIATIFIPLTFIVGIYGMNFDHMPELHWKYGYFATWAVMVVVVLLMLRYFKRKKWF